MKFKDKLAESNSTCISDEKMQLITGQIFIGQAILVAHELGLFKLISKQPLSAKEIADQMGLEERAVQAMISCAGALDLIAFQENRYQLSQIGKTYLDEKNLAYFGKVLDLTIHENEIMNYSNIKKSILLNKSQLKGAEELFSSNDTLSNTEIFIGCLHQKVFKSAFWWPKIIDLKNCKKFVDIGGGSGIHTIAVCLNNPMISGVVCDRPSVVPFTQRYVRDFDLEDRIEITALDMWKDPFPPGDVYFLGDIFHDWKIEKCILLAKKCFLSLPANGQIVLHEMLFNDTKTGPLLTSAYNMKMLAWTEGQQLSSIEMEAILHEAGFAKISVKKALGNWSIITGTKN